MPFAGFAVSRAGVVSPSCRRPASGRPRKARRRARS